MKTTANMMSSYFKLSVNQNDIRSRVRNNTFVVLKVISSDLIPSRWVSETQDVSILMYPWPERMGMTLGPTETFLWVQLQTLLVTSVQ